MDGKGLYSRARHGCFGHGPYRAHPGLDTQCRLVCKLRPFELGGVTADVLPPPPPSSRGQCLVLQGLFLANVFFTDAVVIPRITQLSVVFGISSDGLTRCGAVHQHAVLSLAFALPSPRPPQPPHRSPPPFSPQ